MTAEVAIAGSDDPEAPVVLVHYGSPHTGRHLAPLSAAAGELGIRVLAAPRPGYGDEPRIVGRDIAVSARRALEAIDRLGVGRLATLGYSGGGPHALALAALAPDRVTRVAVLASPAPYDGTTAWLDGTRDRRGLEAALRGRAAREEHERSAEFDPESFTPEDGALLEGGWSALGRDAGAAAGSLGAADDDLAFVRPWGVDLGDVRAPVLVVHGDADRVVPFSHALALVAALPHAELRRLPGAGHIGVLEALPDALRHLIGA